MNMQDLFELSEHDLQQVSGGVVAGESVERDHRDMGGDYAPGKPRHPTGSSWVGSKI
jgi:bacteriocin-like protein